MSRPELISLIRSALREDLGDRGDITSQAVLDDKQSASGWLRSRSDGVVAGVGVAGAVFAEVDPDIKYSADLADGALVEPGTVVATVAGPAQAVLAAERTALNLIGRMSGVATATSHLAAAIEGTHARITDTRKTMPGMRVTDKLAVVAGGGVNHRMGLYDEVVIKDNHLVSGGSITEAVAMARRANGPDVRITIEVDHIDQLAEAVETDANRVLFDNMTPAELGEAVTLVDRRMETEASGGVTLGTVRAIAASGVDFISVGWITHSAPQLDMGLDFHT